MNINADGCCACLQASVRHAHLATSKLLIDSGASLECLGAKNESLLHIAARAGSLPLCRLLVKHGACVNAINDDLETPIFSVSDAPSEVCLPVAKFLIKTVRLVQVKQKPCEFSHTTSTVKLFQL